jgi:hypothetical protein
MHSHEWRDRIREQNQYERRVLDSFGRGFAEKGLYRTFEGGSVLLKVVAPPQNIICTVTQPNDHYAEKEYLVDRRGLKSVTAVQRYHKLEYSALTAVV